MTGSHPGFRLFVLGAGFSIPAGLPSAPELLPLVKAEIESDHGTDTKFHKDLREYVEFRERTEGVSESEPIDLEKMLSKLDMEHFLGLRGKDTWSSEGNESQLMIRSTIARVIHSRTPASDSLPEHYYRFAENLSPRDYVITLNYDLVLEQALEHVGKDYRLHHLSASSQARIPGASYEAKGTAIHKLHGSVDWFDDRAYLELKAAANKQGNTRTIRDVFDHPGKYGTERLIPRGLEEDDPFNHLHRISKVDSYYDRSHALDSPFILSPSAAKFVYAEPLKSLWWGLSRAGSQNLGVNVVGFSLPDHDDHVRLVLYEMIRSYQEFDWDRRWLEERLKDFVRFVDLKKTNSEAEEFKSRYRFADERKCRFHFDGFDDEAVQFLFASPRE